MPPKCWEGKNMNILCLIHENYFKKSITIFAKTSTHLQWVCQLALNCSKDGYQSGLLFSWVTFHLNR